MENDDAGNKPITNREHSKTDDSIITGRRVVANESDAIPLNARPVRDTIKPPPKPGLGNDHGQAGKH
jgi:hypothetical protein